MRNVREFVTYHFSEVISEWSHGLEERCVLFYRLTYYKGWVMDRHEYFWHMPKLSIIAYFPDFILGCFGTAINSYLYTRINHVKALAWPFLSNGSTKRAVGLSILCHRTARIKTELTTVLESEFTWYKTDCFFIILSQWSRYQIIVSLAITILKGCWHVWFTAFTT